MHKPFNSVNNNKNSTANVQLVPMTEAMLPYVLIIESQSYPVGWSVYDNINVATARWIGCDDEKMLNDFRNKVSDNLALDGADNLTYLAPTQVNLTLTMERWPDVKFRATREH